MGAYEFILSTLYTNKEDLIFQKHPISRDEFLVEYVREEFSIFKKKYGSVLFSGDYLGIGEYIQREFWYWRSIRQNHLTEFVREEFSI